nr:MAG TPA: hypothetical protein [Caudoviricetes sp.]
MTRLRKPRASGQWPQASSSRTLPRKLHPACKAWSRAVWTTTAAWKVI